MQRPQTSIGTSQNKFERFYRTARNESGEFYVTPGSARPGTPGQNVLARPPSSLIPLNQVSSASSRLNTISSSSGFPLVGQMNVNIMERPITQHGVAGVRPGTGRGISMTRQIQDKRYYCGLMQLKIRELNHEIAAIVKDIEEQNKERATYLHYDKRAKDLATELTALQGQLADYNIVVDKMTSNIGKEAIEQESEELAAKNEQSMLQIESLFEERRQLEQKLNKTEKQLEDEKKRTERLVDSMDAPSKERYNELLKEMTSLQEKTNDMQQELDKLHKQQLYLEEEIALSPLKQEAVKLHLKIIEAEEKRDKLREEEKHRTSPKEEKEKLLHRIKQDNTDIAAAEAQLAEKKRQMQEVEQNLEQLETDIDDIQSEKQLKYKELRNREEVIEQFMATFDQNKEGEAQKLHNLETTIVGYLENVSNMLDIDINFTGNNEMDILNSLPVFKENEYLNNSHSFERLSKDNLKLQHILSEMGMLEQKIRTEITELNAKLSSGDSEPVNLYDLDGLKNKLMLKQGELIAECERLKQEQTKCEREYETTQSEYNEVKERLENNDIYSQINVLENTMDKLEDEHKKLEDFILKEKQRGNYDPVKKDTFNLIGNYNAMLKETLKTIY